MFIPKPSRSRKTSQRYVIQAPNGHFLAIYSGYTAEQAIANFWHDQDVQSSQYKSWRRGKPVTRMPVIAKPVRS